MIMIMIAVQNVVGLTVVISGIIVVVNTGLSVGF